jgi:hypothetical protein
MDQRRRPVPLDATGAALQDCNDTISSTPDGRLVVLILGESKTLTENVKELLARPFDTDTVTCEEGVDPETGESHSIRPVTLLMVIPSGAPSKENTKGPDPP